MLIKLCGFKDTKTAYAAAALGADFIGIVFHPASPRFVPVADACEIALAVQEGGAEPVGVFVGKSAEEITTVCDDTGITMIQAYGMQGELPSHLRRIYVNEPQALLRPNVDFLLMETSHPGSGKTVDFNTFVPPEEPRWFLAGGLTVHNVQHAIRLFRPLGVDTASGIENHGKKEMALIRQFIEAARGHNA